ncbi:MAG: alpha/beta fold hydrolase [Acidobacteriota bacterium]
MNQEIRFCTAADGVRIAFATSGAGPPLVKAANYLNHLEFDWQSPVWRHVMEELSSRRLLVRYDERGTGLSDWKVADLTFEKFVNDLETVVDALGLRRFALLGISQGGAVSLAYSIRHPERVSRLILYGAYARGWKARASSEEILIRQAMETLIQNGWGQDNPAFRQMWTTLFIPEASQEQTRWFNDLQRMSTSPENAVRLHMEFGQIDVTGLLPVVAVPTLVLHARGDGVVPFEEGRLLAASIPGARFVALEGRNHLLLSGEPAWQSFAAEVQRFLAVESEGDPKGESWRPSSTKEAEFRAGDRLKHYKIASPLGAGGMGAVYLAEDTRLERTVALKVLPFELSSDPERKRRFVLEAKAASAINHSNIAHIYEIDDVDGVLFIAMEYVPGETLQNKLRAGPLQPRALIEIAIQIADALAEGHAQGVVHRDIKPANLMVTPRGQVKVLDFGLAKVTRPQSATGESDVRTALTEPGVVMGTLDYMSPEQALGREVDHRSDIFSLGIVFYEMAAGRRPFSGATATEIIDRIIHAEPEAIGDLHSEHRTELVRIIWKCIEKDREWRYQSVGEMLIDLTTLQRDRGPQPISEPRA